MINGQKERKERKSGKNFSRLLRRVKDATSCITERRRDSRPGNREQGRRLTEVGVGNPEINTLARSSSASLYTAIVAPVDKDSQVLSKNLYTKTSSSMPSNSSASSTYRMHVLL